jgi:hypothetical protein
MPRTDADHRLLLVLKQFLAAVSSSDGADDDARHLLFQLRRHLLLHGVVDDDNDVRALIWKTLLGVERVNADRYCDLIRRGPSDQYQKIRSDSFRTFPNVGRRRSRVLAVSVSVRRSRSKIGSARTR